MKECGISRPISIPHSKTNQINCNIRIYIWQGYLHT